MAALCSFVVLQLTHFSALSLFQAVFEYKVLTLASKFTAHSTGRCQVDPDAHAHAQRKAQKGQRPNKPAFPPNISES